LLWASEQRTLVSIAFAILLHRVALFHFLGFRQVGIELRRVAESNAA